jgi:hypothetical protein
MGDAKRRQKTNVNSHGLSRNIPSEVKREIRKRCGFGCVICGSAIYIYEHVDPLFKDAKEHDPCKMALLCGSCHDKVTDGIWSKEKVKRALENPIGLSKGFSYGDFDIGFEHPEIVLGDIRIANTYNIIEAFGKDLLKIESPEEIRTPFRISAFIYDECGKEIFKIVQNEWQSPSYNWDIEIIGAKITIRHAPKQIILVIRAEPPNRLIFERLNMFYKGGRITASERRGERRGGLVITSPDGSGMSFVDCQMTAVPGGISIHKKGVTLGKGRYGK